jgi:cytochrome P450
VTTSTESHVRFDQYDVELISDPYPMFARLRDEAPLYYNAEYDFFALSRFADVNKALVDHATFSSARGVILELIKANLDIPSGMLIFEDPPIHDMHRKLLARMFTPRKINALEPMIRQFCVQALDPVVGTGRFDFVTDLGAQMPMKVISALLGIPDDDQEYVRDHVNAQLPTHGGGQAHGPHPGSVGGRDVRRLHRLACRESFRRHHD